MKNLDSIVNKIEKHIDDKDKIREQALRFSRDIIINCRKSIQQIHLKEMKKAKENIKVASAKLAELNDLTKPFPDLFHAGFVENAAQELAESVNSNLWSNAREAFIDALNETCGGDFAFD